MECLRGTGFALVPPKLFRPLVRRVSPALQKQRRSVGTDESLRTEIRGEKGDSLRSVSEIDR